MIPDSHMVKPWIKEEDVHNLNVKISCEPGHFICSLNINQSNFEGNGGSLSESLFNLSEEVELAEMYKDYSWRLE